MTRLILAICVMMTLLMPCAWAGEKDMTDKEIKNAILSDAVRMLKLERDRNEQSPMSNLKTNAET